MPLYPLDVPTLLHSPLFLPGAYPAFGAAAKSMAYQMCLALTYLHDCQVAHRDIKPSNWVIGINGTIVLIDFGITYVPGATDEGPGSMYFEIGTG